MDGAASIITVVTTSLSLAQYIKQLVQDVKKQDANAEELKNRLDTLTTALGEASIAYGPQGNYSSSDEEQLRHNVRRIVIDYKRDLERVKIELSKQISQSNWLSLAWRKHHATPTLARIEKSISERQQQLAFLIELLNGRQLRDMNIKLEVLTKLYYPDCPLSITTSGLGASDASTETSHTVAQSRENKSGSHGSLEAQEDIGSQRERESNANGTLLLEAIRTGDNYRFESLFLDRNTSFQEKDDKDRTPLLLAANLDMKDIVKRFLADDTLFSSPNNVVSAEDTNTANHREIDIHLTDTVGRSVLHYCAEFGMCDEAVILLDRGVDVNARDKIDYPPAYYAAKNGKDHVLKLLLERGADTDFERPIPTVSRIGRLLENAPGND